MKKTLLTLALVVSSFAAFAQGRVIFVNDAGRLFTIGAAAPGDAAGLLPTTGLASGRVLNALLYAGTSGNSLSLQTTIPLTGTVISSAAGRMAAKNVVLAAGIPGGVAQSFGIVVVDSATVAPAAINGTLLTENIGSDLSQGFELFPGCSYYGSSGLFTAVPSTSTILYNTLVNTGSPSLSTWNAQPFMINVVPEPSTFALIGLGAAGLLIFRRRK